VDNEGHSKGKKMTTYRKRWKTYDTNTPASIAHADTIRMGETLPALPAGDINVLAGRIEWGASRTGESAARGEAAMVELIAALRDALAAGSEVTIENHTIYKPRYVTHTLSVHVDAHRFFIRGLDCRTANEIANRIEANTKQEVAA
jgi:hypothetical protein